MTTATADAPRTMTPDEVRDAWDRLTPAQRAAFVAVLGPRELVRRYRLPVYQVALSMNRRGWSFERSLAHVLRAIA